SQHIDDIRLCGLQCAEIFQEYRDVEMRSPLRGLLVEKCTLRMRQIPETEQPTIPLPRDNLVQVRGFVEGHECLADSLPGSGIRRHCCLQCCAYLKLSYLYAMLRQYVNHTVMVFVP